MTTKISIDVGGTGASDAATARTNLGVPAKDAATTYGAPQTPFVATGTVTGGNTFTYNPSTHGQICNLTATGAGVVTIAVSAATLVAGTSYQIRVIAGDTSARTFAKHSTVKTSGGTAMPIASATVTSGAADRFFFVAIDSNTMECVGSVADVR